MSKQLVWYHRRMKDPAFRKKRQEATQKYRDKIGKEEYNRRTAESNKRRKVERWLATRGWTERDYLRLQLKGCALCGKRKYLIGRDYLMMDHDHKTQRARGLLCPNCNRMLGWFEGRRKQIEAYVSQ